MKKWKDIPKSEKWMLVIILMLIIGIILRWDFVREELSGAFNWFDSDTKTEAVTPAE